MEACTFHPSWSKAGRQLVDRAIERHGGWLQWTHLEAIRVRPLRLGGLLPWLKGFPRSFSLPTAITSFPKRWRTELADYPSPGVTGIFEAGDVLLLDAAAGRVVARSTDHRGTFRGLHKYRRWSPLDALYFFGYAFVGYSAQPFLLPRCRFLKTVVGSSAANTRPS